MEDNHRHMSRNRTPHEKVADWLAVYQAISAEVTPPELRAMLGKFNEVMGAATDPAEAISLLQQSMNLARLVSANDRTAVLAAAMLTSGGGARVVTIPGEGD